MDTRSLITALFLGIATAQAEDKMISEFEATPPTVGELFAIIVPKVETGTTDFRFPDGRFTYHDLRKANLPAKASFEVNTFDLTNDRLEEDIVEWMKGRGVSALGITLHENAKAKSFFRLEAIIRAEGVLYTIVLNSNDEGNPDRVILAETDGRPLFSF